MTRPTFCLAPLGTYHLDMVIGLEEPDSNTSLLSTTFTNDVSCSTTTRTSCAPSAGLFSTLLVCHGSRQIVCRQHHMAISSCSSNGMYSLMAELWDGNGPSCITSAFTCWIIMESHVYSSQLIDPVSPLLSIPGL